MLAALEFELNIPIPYRFLRRYAKVIVINRAIISDITPTDLSLVSCTTISNNIVRENANRQLAQSIGVKGKVFRHVINNS